MNQGNARALPADAEPALHRSGDLPPIVRALLQPDAYPHPAGDLQLHETHASWVILAGPYAYKLRKPVDLGFLDFSTRERRAADCAAEVRLNRRLCPDVYLGVVEIAEREGTYAVGGAGHRVEPAVRMRRLPAEGMLSRMLARGAVSVPLVRRIARRLARFHARAATGPGVDAYGSPTAVRANWAENFAQIEPFLDRTIPAAIGDAIRRYVEDFLTTERDLFERRVAAGRVRDGHGDLHADSICVEGRRIHLFDCLQFAERFRCADVAADVAFLAMDLDHHGRADLSTAFVEAYVAASGDAGLTALLRFYTCYRAFVRGKVRSLRLAQPGLSPAQEADLVNEARAYFDLAWAYAGGLARPALFVTMGLPASGKTAVARALAGRLGLVHLSSDVTRKELAGLPPAARRPEAFQEGLYGPAMTRRTYDTLRRRAARWLRRDRSVVLDATFGRAEERAALLRLADRTGAPLMMIHCQADEATLRSRLAARAHAGGEETGTDARLELWPALRAAFSDPVEIPAGEIVAIDTTVPLTAAVERVLTALRSRT